MSFSSHIPLARIIALLIVLVAAVPAARMAENGIGSSHEFGPVDLVGLPQKVDEWTKAGDHPIDGISQKELQPDDYLSRVYEDPSGFPIELLVVYGHLKMTFHSPEQCLPGGGFQIAAKAKVGTQDGLPWDMNLFRIERKDRETGRVARAVVLYCFVQGEKATPNLIQHNINLLAAHFSRRKPTGAFVRIVVPIASTEQVAVARGKSFVRSVYPELQKRISPSE
jgi:EpsI family protein